MHEMKEKGIARQGYTGPYIVVVALFKALEIN